MFILLYSHLYSVFVFGVGFAYVVEVNSTVTFRLLSGSLAAYYSIMCHIDTIWCVGMGGCF